MSYFDNVIDLSKGELPEYGLHVLSFEVGTAVEGKRFIQPLSRLFPVTLTKKTTTRDVELELEFVGTDTEDVTTKIAEFTKKIQDGVDILAHDGYGYFCVVEKIKAPKEEASWIYVMDLNLVGIRHKPKTTVSVSNGDSFNVGGMIDPEAVITVVPPKSETPNLFNPDSLLESGFTVDSEGIYTANSSYSSIGFPNDYENTYVSFKARLTAPTDSVQTMMVTTSSEGNDNYDLELTTEWKIVKYTFGSEVEDASIFVDGGILEITEIMVAESKTEVEYVPYFNGEATVKITDENGDAITEFTVSNVTDTVIVDGMKTKVTENGQNKFRDTVLFEFPRLAVGKNNVEVTGAVEVSISYYPMYL